MNDLVIKDLHRFEKSITISQRTAISPDQWCIGWEHLSIEVNDGSHCNYNLCKKWALLVEVIDQFKGLIIYEGLILIHEKAGSVYRLKIIMK